MIDFIKGYVNDKYLAARLRNTICTVAEVDTSTGEISANSYIGKLSQFKIRVFDSGRIQFQGSLHKYHSCGSNKTDFYFEEVCQTIFSFCQLVGIKPENFILENIEFGVNISIQYPPSILLSNIICLTCGKMFEIQEGNGRKCELFDYRHKIYQKVENLLRYELHIDKMRKISPVKTLYDLVKIENWIFFQSLLLRHFAQIVFTDSYSENQFSKWQTKYFISNGDKINNSRFWKGLSPVKRHHHLKRLRELQEKGKFKFSKTIGKLIGEKVEELKTVKQFHRSNTG